MSTNPKSLHLRNSSLSFSLSHTHVLHQLGPLASGSPQWNFHAAIWRSIGDRDLLSGLHVPLEKTRKPEHIGFCKSEGEERRGGFPYSSWISPMPLVTIARKEASLCMCACLCCVCRVHFYSICVKVQLSRYGSKTEQVLTPILCGGIMKEIEEMELSAFKLTVNFRKTTGCERKGHCYWKTKNADWCHVCSDAMPFLCLCVRVFVHFVWQAQQVLCRNSN